MVGTIANHPTDETSMLYTPNVDTLPGNTLSPVTAIIDPATVDVEDYSLMTPSSGTRYLILNPIGRYTNIEAAEAWDQTNPLFVANAGDIIEYRNGQWTVSFDSENSTDYQYVTNLTTTVQYKYDFNVREWAKSVEGVYSFNNWSIVI